MPAGDTELQLAIEQFDDRLEKALAEPEADMPRTLHHYTSAAGLEGILRGRSVWATHQDYLNDPSEATEGGKVIRAFLQDNKTKSKLGAMAGAMLTLDGPGSHLHGEDDNTCIASFSDSEDDLPQWLAYGDRARGFSVGFDLKAQVCRKVLYEKSALEARAQDLINAAEESFAAVLDSHRPKEAEKFLAHSALRLLKILRWGACYKDKAWRHEKEWRLLGSIDGPRAPKLRVRVRAHQLVPYVQVPLWTQGQAPPITKILWGPAQEPGPARFAVEALWCTAQPGERFELPLINPSGIRYRASGP